MSKLTFNISDTRVLELDVELKHQYVTTIYERSPMSSNNIVAPSERNYEGLTRRLRQFTGKDGWEMPALIAEIAQHNVAVAWQSNLNIDVEE